ncbi:Fos-related antigen 2, partial [Ophiophagus hannah]
MYQDFPANFDTSSRGSSTSPGHPETYSSITTQQVGVSPGTLVAKLPKSGSDIEALFLPGHVSFLLSQIHPLSPVCGPPLSFYCNVTLRSSAPFPRTLLTPRERSQLLNQIVKFANHTPVHLLCERLDLSLSRRLEGSSGRRVSFGLQSNSRLSARSHLKRRRKRPRLFKSWGGCGARREREKERESPWKLVGRRHSPIGRGWGGAGGPLPSLVFLFFLGKELHGCPCPRDPLAGILKSSSRTRTLRPLGGLAFRSLCWPLVEPKAMRQRRAVGRVGGCFGSLGFGGGVVSSGKGGIFGPFSPEEGIGGKGSLSGRQSKNPGRRESLSGHLHAQSHTRQVKGLGGRAKERSWFLLWTFKSAEEEMNQVPACKQQPKCRSGHL